MLSFKQQFDKELKSIDIKNDRAYLPCKYFGFSPDEDIDLTVPIPLFYLIYRDQVKFRIPKRFFQDNILLGEIVSIPNKIFTGNLVKTGIVDDYEKQYIEDYDFHYFRHSVNISEKYNDKLKIDTVNINCKLNHFLSEEDRPLVTHHFPTTRFSERNDSKSEVKLYISGGLGFEGDIGKMKGQGSAKSNADFEYKYNPKAASISSYANGSELDFTFNKTNANDTYPTGALEIFGIIMRPRKLKNIALKTSVTINNHPIPFDGLTKLLISESEPDEILKD